MRLIDLLVLMLETHAETLKRLAAFFGEEDFLEMLEGLESDSIGGGKSGITLDLSRVPFSVIGTRLPTGARSPYVELEGTVRELHLPAVLEFHLWAYPPYRAFIESDLDLGSSCESAESGASQKMSALVDFIVAQAKEWVREIPIPPSVAAPAEAAALQPWIKFRTSVFRKMGFRPMESV